MLLALLLAPALAVIAFVLFRRLRPKPVRVLAAETPPPATKSGEVDPLPALDALLRELEGATVRIGAADALDREAVAELELLAERIEGLAAALEGVR